MSKMIENFDNIMVQMPDELIGEEETMNPKSLEPDVQLEVDVGEEEKPSSSTCVAKGNKMLK